MLMTPAWTIALLVSVAAIVTAALPGDATLHLAVAGLIGATLTAAAVRENWMLLGAAASKAKIAGATARSNGVVWAWGALSILLTYLFVEDRAWKEWWAFVLGFGAAAVGSFAYAAMMARDDAAGKDDPAIHKIGRTLIIAQVVGIIAALISMFVDGKFPRDLRYADWAGCNIFLVGGVAILIISLNALRSSR